MREKARESLIALLFMKRAHMYTSYEEKTLGLSEESVRTPSVYRAEQQATGASRS